MKRLIIFIVAFLMLSVSVAIAAPPQDGDEHYCRVDSEILIVYDEHFDRWEWWIPTGLVNPDTGLSAGPRISVTRCPKCGCKPQNDWCWIWEQGDD